MMIDFRSILAIGLGGNLPFEGSPTADTLVRAVQRLSETGLVIRAVSRFFETPCFPAGAGPDYVNAAILVHTRLQPSQVLQRLHDTEMRFGRARTQRWGMRTLDLDLLTWDGRVLPDAGTFRHWLDLPPEDQVSAAPDQLIVPHPRLQDRAFAIVPLADIAPDWVHPVLHRSVRQLRDALPVEEIAAVRPIQGRTAHSSLVKQ
jgi:2-amino-4-hydroxy-6-hydroxymethyldihydropteridine diphosphokinase